MKIKIGNIISFGAASSIDIIAINEDDSTELLCTIAIPLEQHKAVVIIQTVFIPALEKHFRMMEISNNRKN
jgi:hypothetical protein